MLEMEKSLWLFCSKSLRSHGPLWGVSGVEFRDQFECFLPGHPCPVPNFLLNTSNESDCYT